MATILNECRAPEGLKRDTNGMKVLMVGMDWLPNGEGGLNRYFYDAVNALPDVGVEGSALVTFLHPGQCASLRLHAMAPPGASLLQVWRGARIAARRELQTGIDLVNAHHALYAWPWLRDLPRDMPLVVNFQGPWAEEISVEATKRFRKLRIMLARHIERRVYQRANGIITLSEAFRDEVQGRYGVAPNRVRVVPGGVDTRPFLAAPDRQRARNLLNWPQDRPIIMSVRRLTRRMGLENLVAAFDAVRGAHPDALLYIGGKGHLSEELQHQIDRLGLREQVKLLGFIPDADLPLAYAAADIMVVPTLALEGFGLVTLEALAAGTPVMGTPIGGTPEILRRLDERLIFDAATPAAMAAHITAALDGRLELPDRATCRQFAQQYAWSEIAPRLRDVFEEFVVKP